MVAVHTSYSRRPASAAAVISALRSALVASVGTPISARGRPQPPTAASGHSEHDAALPWSLRGHSPAASHGPSEIDTDEALAVAQARGVALPLTIGLPGSAGEPYLFSHIATRQQDAHVVYVDPSSGAVLLEAHGDDFGIGAKAFEFGIYTHQGQQFGEANRLLMLIACIAVVVLCATAPVMWWKRRQGGLLSAPPRAADRSKESGTALVMLAVGALFPLTGATMLAALAGEWLLRRARRAAS